MKKVRSLRRWAGWGEQRHHPHQVSVCACKVALLTTAAGSTLFPKHMVHEGQRRYVLFKVAQSSAIL